MGVGRVIARPFIGAPGAFRRTANRRDFALTPFAPTLLDRVKDAGLPVVAIGKIEDLFAGRGITSAVHTASDEHGMDEVLQAMATTPRGLIFANLVDFDTRLRPPQRRRRATPRNLERFDARLGELLPRLAPSDLLVVTADHGNDPTTPEHRSLARVRAGVRHGAVASAPAWTSARGRPSPTSVRRSPRCSASGRWHTATEFPRGDPSTEFRRSRDARGVESSRQLPRVCLDRDLLFIASLNDQHPRTTRGARARRSSRRRRRRAATTRGRLRAEPKIRSGRRFSATATASSTARRSAA